MTRPRKIHKPLGVTFVDALEHVTDEQKPQTRTLAARPFLKWVGGKRSILGELTKRMPATYHAYVEPFLGGGALYFAIQPERAYLSDINFHLMITFQVVQDDVDRLIHNLKIHAGRHNKEYYLRARKRMFKEKDQAKIAALFIYLNKTCYNGLYRVNKSGQFNVPMGDYKDPAIVDEDNLRAASELLRNTDIKQHDFLQIKPRRGNFYYIDPPYHKTFDQYNGSGFDDKEHEKLASFCHDIDNAGGLFMVSNSDTPFVRSLYKRYTIEEVNASRFISCKADQRGKHQELIIRNYS